MNDFNNKSSCFTKTNIDIKNIRFLKLHYFGCVRLTVRSLSFLKSGEKAKNARESPRA